MTEEEIVMYLRGLMARGLVIGVNDAGASQTVNVSTHAGITRQLVPVLQPYGFASHPPAGAMTLVLAIGGDQGDMVALPLAAPDHRFGGLAPGEVAFYDAAGSRVENFARRVAFNSPVCGI